MADSELSKILARRRRMSELRGSNSPVTESPEIPPKSDSTTNLEHKNLVKQTSSTVSSSSVGNPINTKPKTPAISQPPEAKHDSDSCVDSDEWSDDNSGAAVVNTVKSADPPRARWQENGKPSKPTNNPSVIKSPPNSKTTAPRHHSSVSRGRAIPRRRGSSTTTGSLAEQKDPPPPAAAATNSTPSTTPTETAPPIPIRSSPTPPRAPSPAAAAAAPAAQPPTQAAAIPPAPAATAVGPSPTRGGLFRELSDSPTATPESGGSGAADPLFSGGSGGSKGSGSAKRSGGLFSTAMAREEDILFGQAATAPARTPPPADTAAPQKQQQQQQANQPEDVGAAAAATAAPATAAAATAATSSPPAVGVNGSSGLGGSGSGSGGGGGGVGVGFGVDLSELPPAPDAFLPDADAGDGHDLFAGLEGVAGATTTAAAAGGHGNEEEEEEELVSLGLGLGLGSGSGTMGVSTGGIGGSVSPGLRSLGVDSLHQAILGAAAAAAPAPADAADLAAATEGGGGGAAVGASLLPSPSLSPSALVTPTRADGGGGAQAQSTLPRARGSAGLSAEEEEDLELLFGSARKLQSRWRLFSGAGAEAQGSAAGTPDSAAAGAAGGGASPSAAASATNAELVAENEALKTQVSQLQAQLRERDSDVAASRVQMGELRALVSSLQAEVAWYSKHTRARPPQAQAGSGGGGKSPAAAYDAAYPRGGGGTSSSGNRSRSGSRSRSSSSNSTKGRRGSGSRSGRSRSSGGGGSSESAAVLDGLRVSGGETASRLSAATGQLTAMGFTPDAVSAVIDGLNAQGGAGQSTEILVQRAIDILTHGGGGGGGSAGEKPIVTGVDETASSSGGGGGRRGSGRSRAATTGTADATAGSGLLVLSSDESSGEDGPSVSLSASSSPAKAGNRSANSGGGSSDSRRKQPLRRENSNLFLPASPRPAPATATAASTATSGARGSSGNKGSSSKGKSSSTPPPRLGSIGRRHTTTPAAMAGLLARDDWDPLLGGVATTTAGAKVRRLSRAGSSSDMRKLAAAAVASHAAGAAAPADGTAASSAAAGGGGPGKRLTRSVSTNSASTRTLGLGKGWEFTALAVPATRSVAGVGATPPSATASPSAPSPNSNLDDDFRQLFGKHRSASQDSDDSEGLFASVGEVKPEQRSRTRGRTESMSDMSGGGGGGDSSGGGGITSPSGSLSGVSIGGDSESGGGDTPSSLTPKTAGASADAPIGSYEDFLNRLRRPESRDLVEAIKFFVLTMLHAVSASRRPNLDGSALYGVSHPTAPPPFPVQLLSGGGVAKRIRAANTLVGGRIRQSRSWLMAVTTSAEAAADACAVAKVRAPIARRITEFFTRMERAFAAHPLWMSEQEEELVAAAREGIEKYVMSKIGGALLQHADEDAAQDEVLRKRMALLQFLEPKHLDIEESCPNPLVISVACDGLNKMNQYLAPVDKIQCIVRCSTYLFNQISLARGGGGGGAASADDFLPIFIYVVLQARTPRLHSNLEYISRYRNPSDLMSKAGYCFVNLRSAVSFIETMTPDQLSITQSDFEHLYAKAEKRWEASGGRAEEPRRARDESL